MKKFQVGFDKFTQTPIYQELTYEFFLAHIGWEWTFYYQDNIIEISLIRNNGYLDDDFTYCLCINGYDERAIRQEYSSEEDLIKNARIFGKTLKEIWNELETENTFCDA